MAPEDTDSDQRRSRSQQIAADLRTAIGNSEYRPGQALPSVSTLMKRYGVARQTVQTALGMLHAEGLTEPRTGAGVFVKERPVLRRLARSRLSRESRDAGRGAFLGDASTAGFTPTVEVDISVEAADEATATALAVEVGSEVLVRSRVMKADGTPVQLATSRFPRALTVGTRIEQEDTGPGGSHSVLEEQGHRLGYHVERVRSRGATADEALLLRIHPGAAVGDVTRVTYTEEGTPVEVNHMILAGEWFELVYEFPAD